MTVEYTHTQRGDLILLILIPAAALLGLAELRVGPIRGIRSALLVTLLVLALFPSLTTTVYDGILEVRFGLGPIRRRIKLSEVEEAEVVTIPRYYGWGIRLTPQGWLWRVSGSQAVQLTFRDGRRFQIGTDRPDDLLRAISPHMNSDKTSVR